MSTGPRPKSEGQVSDEELMRQYADIPESGWRTMAPIPLRMWVLEVESRGLATPLREKLMLTSLPHERAMYRQAEMKEAGARAGEAIVKAVFPSASTSPSTARENAVAVEPDNSSAPPSFEENCGAPTVAGNGFAIEAYLRLPLAAKRDAFVHDGFLYVREGVLAQWVEHFTVGKCCPARKVDNGHNSDCWLGKLV